MQTCRSICARLTLMALILISIAAGTPASCAEPDSLSSAGAPGLDAKRYYDMGSDAAKHNFYFIGPIAVGTITGMTLPVATGAAAAAGYQAFDALSVVTGAGAFGLWLWGGDKLSKHLPEPSPDRHTGGFSPTERQAFEDGYRQNIEGGRSAGFKFGVILGIGIDLYLLSLIFADFQGFGV